MSITSANAIITLTVPLLFPIPQQLEQFAVDDIYGTDPIEAGQAEMGADGHLTAGFVNVPTKQNYSLMADSPSNFLFDQIYLQEKANQEKFVINGVVLLTSLGTKWTMVRGFLTRYQPLPDAKKVLQSRKHEITWQTATPQAS